MDELTFFQLAFEAIGRGTAVWLAVLGVGIVALLVSLNGKGDGR